MIQLQDLSGIDPNDIPMDDSRGYGPFSGTEVLVTAEQIGTPTGMLGIQSLGPTLTGAWRGPIHDLLRSLSALYYGTDVWLGNKT